MIPLRDNIPSRSTPVINYLMITICALVFMAQLSQRPGQASLIERYGMIPARVFHPDSPVEVPDRELRRTPFGLQVREVMRPAAESAVPSWSTLLTCIFLHSGWMHFVGNMWFLYIFGDNVEDRLGHIGFLMFYLGCGIAASGAHLMTASGSSMPTIGASGAIAGVMGAYLLLYPRAKVLTLVPIVFFLHVVVLPAPIFLGIWFAIQFFQGTFAITSIQSTGVAWWAHIGGFVAGALVAWMLGRAHRLRSPVKTALPYTDQITHYRLRRHNRPRF